MSLGRPGQVLAGRYRIERLLAQGGHGAVFVAEQLATEAKVALKLLWPHVLESDGARERFALEAKLIGRIRSDFVVRVIDAGVDEPSGVPFLAMELLEGESLADVVERSGPFSLLNTTTCLLQVCEGLAKAHAHCSAAGKPTPIVHRDLKPENVFWILREDGQRAAKILDFGVARIVEESAARSLTVNGSPLYMAYEQLTGQPISARTDVWSVALVAFFLMTGKSYWRSASAATVAISAIFAEILHMPLVEPSQRARQLGIEPPWPAAFDAWFLKCVNRDAQIRFSSTRDAASALCDALLGAHENTLQSLPLPVLTDDSIEPISRFEAYPNASGGRPKRRLIAASALVFLAFAAGASALLFHARAKDQPRLTVSTRIPAIVANRLVEPVKREPMPAEASVGRASTPEASAAPNKRAGISLPAKSAGSTVTPAPNGDTSVLGSSIYSER